MTRKEKLAIIFSVIGAAAVGIGITIAIVYNQTMGAMFHRLVVGEEEDDANRDLNSEPTLGYLTHYKATLTVGEEGTFDAHSKFGKAPYTYQWKFSDGLTLTGENVTRSFELPGKYSFYLTVTDGNGDKVTSTELNTNVVQEMAKKEGTDNTTSISTN